MAPYKKWQNYEKKVAQKHGGRHVGGPGNPDWIRGGKAGEAKLRKGPLNKTEVMMECQKGRKIISCPKGFTEPAKEYVRRYRKDIKLIQE